MSEATLVEDLATPVMPDWFLELHTTMGLGPDQAMTPDGLLDEALRREGTLAGDGPSPTDFGDPWFREPFTVLVESIEHETAR